MGGIPADTESSVAKLCSRNLHVFGSNIDRFNLNIESNPRSHVSESRVLFRLSFSTSPSFRSSATSACQRDWCLVISPLYSCSFTTRILCNFALTASRARCLDASTSARLQRASSAPYLHASSSTYLQRACSVPATRLHVSIPPNLYVATPAARLHPSMPNSTSAHLQCASRAPFVHTSTSLRLLSSSMPLHTYP